VCAQFVLLQGATTRNIATWRQCILRAATDAEIIAS